MAGESNDYPIVLGDDDIVPLSSNVVSEVQTFLPSLLSLPKCALIGSSRVFVSRYWKGEKKVQSGIDVFVQAAARGGGGGGGRRG